MQDTGQLLDTTRDKAADPAPLFLCMTGVDARAIEARFMEDAALPAPEAFSPDVLARVADSEQKAVVVFRTAEDFLLAAMSEGRAPGEALAAWIDEAADILQVRSQRRRQISLIRDRHFLEGSRKSLGPLIDLAGTVVPGATNEPAPEPIYRVLARQVVADSPQAQALALDLEASALPWTDDAAPIDLDAIYQAHRGVAAAEQERAAALNDQTEQESVLRDQIAQLQDEIVGRVQQADLERETWQKRQASLTATGERERAEIAALKASLAEGKQEIETLQQNIKKLTSELRQTQDAKRVAQNHAASLEVERATVFASTSWKITRPLRALKGLFGGNAGKKIV